MPAASLTRFIEALSESPLLTAQQREELPELCARCDDSRGLAQVLMRRGWLTAFQINLIAKGRLAELLLGPYVLLDLLGEGGMGQVFKARQCSLQRIVALKVIRSELLTNPRVIKRFVREIRAASQLAHPNVVHAYDADERNGAYYIAMEYVEGIDLARLVKQSGPLPVWLACDLIRQAALGLQHAFERGLIHRDIKPANLLLSGMPVRGPVADTPLPAPIVKITDFGLARWADDDPDRPTSHLTQIGSFLGTPEFISPEQARNSSNCDVRSDLYSLGCTLYYLLAGQPPFASGTMTDKLLQHQLDRAEPVGKARRARLSAGLDAQALAALRPEILEVPAAVEQVVERLLAKRPEERYQVPAELAEVLTGLAARWARGGLPIPPQPQPETLVEFALTPRATTPRLVLPVVPVAKPVATAPAVPGAMPRVGPSPRRRLWPWLLVPALLLVPMAAVGVGVLLLAAWSAADRNADQAEAEQPDEAHWHRLMHKARRKPPVAMLRTDLFLYRTQYAGSAHAHDADEWLARLPSQFDSFDRVLLPKVPRVTAKSPPEMVGVLGNDQGYFKQPADVVTVSPDGRWLLGSEGPALRLWDTANFGHAPARLAPSGQHLNDAAFAPDGKRLATASDAGGVWLWNVATRERAQHLEKGKAPITRLAFRGDGRLLATAGVDGQICLWDAATGSEAGSIAAGAAGVQALTFSADGRTLFWSAGANVHWLRVRDAHNSTPRPAQLVAPAPIRVLAFAPDGRTLLCGGGQGNVLVCAWDGTNLVKRAALEHRDVANKKPVGLPVNQAAFAADGKHFATAGSDHRVRVWDAASLTLQKEWNVHCPVRAVAFALDSRHLISGNGNSTLTIFRLAPYTADTAN